MATLPAPKGLGVEGRRLWKTLTTSYDWSQCPERLHTVEACCRTLDLAQRLQATIDAAESLRTRGSAGPHHMVQLPEVASLVSVRAQYVTLTKSLCLGEADVPEFGAVSGGPMSRSESGRKAANARWSRYG